nr:uncharacterized protein CI109_005815 [Kwoniella shandongensis]KAA5525793.1 hypothetical protein CI109_005815 [Kwoniella shandongensis]
MFATRQPLLAAARSLTTRGHKPPPLRSPTPIPKPKNVDPLAPSSSSSTATATATGSSSSASSSLEAQEGEGEGGWYNVGRSSGGELPVYSKIRNGGGITTVVRKVEGDLTTIQKQLNAYFAQSHIDPFSHPPSVTIRPTNGHLQVKGHWVEEVKGWLEGKGF